MQKANTTYFSSILQLVILACSILFLTQFIYGQKSKTTEFFATDTVHQKIVDRFVKENWQEKNATDSAQLKFNLKKLIDLFHSRGFPLAGIDSTSRNAKFICVYIFCGNKFEWVQLSEGKIDSKYLDGSGYGNKKYLRRSFNYSDIETINKKILENCENNGYPFAEVKLDSIQLNSNGVRATMVLTKNNLNKIDSVILKGNPSIAPIYINNYIGIFPGDIYNESKLKKISARLKELAFLKEVRPSQVAFSEKGNKLYLFLENKKASQFDGVIGFLPDETNVGKLNLTGEVHLKLQNSFRRGEILELNWKQVPPRSQDLKFHVLYPFLFNSPFGIDGNISIFKRDSIFVDVIKNLGIQYSLGGNNLIKAFVNDKESNLQSTKGYKNITVLPPFADVTTVSYGTSFHYEKLDYRLNPQKGIALDLLASAGNRSIRKNSDINPIVYDNLNLTSTTYQLELNADYYQSLGSRHVLDIGTKSAEIYNTELFTNEMYRIGGLKSLRGFDEESIYASTFVIGKIEYRYQVEQNSFLFAFYNQAWYARKTKNTFATDKPFGFGAGINFETRIGIMSVSYALGKQFDNPIYFRNGKVHFGIVNYF